MHLSGGASKRGSKTSGQISTNKRTTRKDALSNCTPASVIEMNETSKNSMQAEGENVLIESIHTIIEGEGVDDAAVEKLDGTHDSDDDFDQEIPVVISNEHSEDLLKKLAKFPLFPSIMVPLCRLQINTRVRPLRQEKEELKTAFHNEGYVKEKGMFILSITLCDGSFVLVDDTLREQWGDRWQHVNEEFEMELATHPELSELSEKMFFVWEGNHRTAAWMEVIHEELWNDPSKHIRVMATFIEPDPKSEMQLVATLQRLNL